MRSGLSVLRDYFAGFSEAERDAVFGETATGCVSVGADE